MATAPFQLSVRKPLQPKNTPAGNDTIVFVVNKEAGSRSSKSKPKQLKSSNKENQLNPVPNDDRKHATPAKKMEAESGEIEMEMGASLAEELSAIRKRMERLRLDKEKTERMLREREGVLHFQLKELEERGQIQKQLENEVDRLFRLKELKSYCMRISPIKSLRERQQEDKRIHGGKSLSLEIKDDSAEEEESVDENTLQSPTPSDSSEFVRDNDNSIHDSDHVNG